MKKIKQYIMGMVAIGAIAGFTTSCQDDFEDNNIPGFDEPVATMSANTTILELKQLYWQDAVNYIDTIGVREDGSHYIISGRVLSSDRTGNVYKKLVIQDETAALALSINYNSLYNEYRVGQEIVLDATGMYIGKYNGTQQLGYPYFYEKGAVWEATFMPYEMFHEHMQLNGLPEPEKVDTITIRNFSELPGNSVELCEYQSRLVRFNNVYFADGGVKEFTDGYKVTTNRLLYDTEGQSITVRTSGYATFREEMLPAGNGDVVAILDYYATSDDADSPWQLTLIDAAGCMNFGNPTIEPGGEDNPYTVEQAVALEKSGKTGKGWTTGYIVGAVAPEVTTVTSSADIEWGSEVVLANTLVIGPTASCTDISKCLVISLPIDTKLREVGNLRDNPDNFGKQIWLYGVLEEYMGTWGITGNSGAVSQFRIEGVETGGGSVSDGAGTQESPYNVGQVIALNPTSTTESPAGGSGVWVEGYIVGYMPSTPSTVLSNAVFASSADLTTNIVLGPTVDCTDYTKCIGIQLPNNTVRAALNLQENPGVYGAHVKLYGDVMKYCSGPGLKNTTQYEMLSEGTGGGDGGGDTTPDTGAGEGEGTLASPYNVARALSIINSGSYTSEKVYVTGIVSQIDEIDTGSFGNATYYISDDGTTTNQLEVYRGYSLDGAKFTSADEIKVGDVLVVYGELTLFYSTPEITVGSSIVSINGQTSGGDSGSGDSGSGDSGSSGGSGDTSAAGSGSEADPYNCAAVIDMNPSSTTDAVASGVWVKGYIVGYMPNANLSGTAFTAEGCTVNTNLVVAPYASCTDVSQCITVQLPAEAKAPGVRSALNLVDNPSNLGKEVMLYGDVMKYCQGPGVKNTSQYKM